MKGEWRMTQSDTVIRYKANQISTLQEDNAFLLENYLDSIDQADCTDCVLDNTPPEQSTSSNVLKESTSMLEMEPLLDMSANADVDMNLAFQNHSANQTAYATQRDVVGNCNSTVSTPP